MDKTINLQKILNKLNKINNKNSKSFFKKNKMFNDLIERDYIKKKKENLSSYQVKKIIEKTLKPNIDQLYFLYSLITIFKRITALEIGVGWSTSIISEALIDNSKKISGRLTKDLRFSEPYKLFSVDNDKKFINITKKRLTPSQKKITNFYFSRVRMTEYKKRICTEFEKLPLINPDFIFIDGPGQYNVFGNINGFNTGHPDLAPMSLDILKIEPFLKPGTFLLIDGRALNALFLKNFFYRNWDYRYFKDFDLHLFLLNGPFLGELNKKQLKFQNII